MRIGSLCSGIGGLELGLERAGLGRTVWQAEIDPHASQVLARHWPGVPNLGDFRDQPLPDCDVLIGGFPCQPVSSAGRRKGTEDERWLFDDIVEAVGRMGTPPRLFVFENVRGLLSANGGDAMARVVHGLAGLGLVGSYGLLRAADVGAPHRRERVFIVAADADGGAAGRNGRPVPSSVHGWAGRDVCPAEHGGGTTAADSERLGSHRPSDDARRRQPDSGRSDRWREGQGSQTSSGVGQVAADTEVTERRGPQHDPVATATRPATEPRERHRTDTDWGPYAPAVARWEHLTRPAPAPTEIPESYWAMRRRRAARLDRRPVGMRGTLRPSPVLNPAFVEWMMGFPEGWVDGLTRTAALRCLGNAVVPQVAELLGRIIVGSPVATTEADGHLLPTPQARDGDARGPQGKRYLNPARSNNLDDAIDALRSGLLKEAAA